MLVLITYDINVTSSAGQRRLRQVAKQCVNYGVRVQNSVFECVVDATQWVRLRHMLLELIDPTADSIRFYRLGDKYQGKIEHHGAKPTFQVEDTLIF